ncbi:MAG TPA: RES family NAD+ phosphorylase [Candidatus Bathyarchaeia archaeon]|nr:RES family NAD+ phosphorylase [Candidatus Bathyarchaeia archaeon]
MRRVQRGGAYFRIADVEWADPLSAAYSVASGGRWNPPGSCPVLYLNRDLQTSRANLARKFVGLPYGPEMLDPARAPVLIQTTVRNAEFVDAVTDDGCIDLGLPVTYPLDEAGNEVGWDRCQPIGRRAWDAGESGIACRSAATHDRAGEELALFVRTGDLALPIDRRLSFDEWFQ